MIPENNENITANNRYVLKFLATFLLESAGNISNEFINKMSDDLIKEIDEIYEDSTSNKNETAITKDDFTSIKSSELIELLDKMISDD